MPTQILTPIQIFTDINGEPLDDGFIFIGTAGLDPVTNPISIFFDAALTIPASQPIRTIGGYPVNAGVRTRLYGSPVDYSILVRNKNSTTVHSVTAAVATFITGPASSTDNNLPLFSGTSGKELKDSGTTVTAAGRALLDDATAAAQRTTLGSTAVGDAVFIAATAAAARAAIGTVIGTDVQAQDADLQALADNSTNGLWARTGAGTGAARTLIGTANKITVTNGDGVAANPTLTIPDAVTLVTPTVTGLLDATGGQVKFPATQVPSGDANTLDDYEEGTWTPVLTFATPGNLVVVYSIQDGRYTKIGRFISESLTIRTSTFTHTTASGNLNITGNPFTSGFLVTGNTSWQGITKAGYSQVNLRINSSSTVIEGYASGSGQGGSSITTADMPTGGAVEFFGGISFIVA